MFLKDYCRNIIFICHRIRILLQCKNSETCINYFVQEMAALYFISSLPFAGETFVLVYLGIYRYI